jgi:hypothetical protein
MSVLHGCTGDSASIKDAELKALDASLDGIITELVENADFKAKQVPSKRCLVCTGFSLIPSAGGLQLACTPSSMCCVLGMEPRDCLNPQGSSSFARLGGNARIVGIVGLGSASAPVMPDWGPSPYQVCLPISTACERCLRTMASVCASIYINQLTVRVLISCKQLLLEITRRLSTSVNSVERQCGSTSSFVLLQALGAALASAAKTHKAASTAVVVAGTAKVEVGLSAHQGIARCP